MDNASYRSATATGGRIQAATAGRTGNGLRKALPRGGEAASQKEGHDLKATGIVRRIDDLGRVVIPKEIRRTMRIREGDPLEIYTDNDGEVIFKKYSPIGELSHFSNQYAEVLWKTSGFPVLVADRDRIVSASGTPRKDVADRRITEELEALLEQRKPYMASAGQHPVTAADGLERPVAVAVPILVAGDITGAVILLTPDSGAAPGPSELKLTQTAAGFLAKQMEE